MELTNMCWHFFALSNLTLERQERLLGATEEKREKVHDTRQTEHPGHGRETGKFHKHRDGVTGRYTANETGGHDDGIDDDEEDHSESCEDDADMKNVKSIRCLRLLANF